MVGYSLVASVLLPAPSSSRRRIIQRFQTPFLSITFHRRSRLIIRRFGVVRAFVSSTSDSKEGGDGGVKKVVFGEKKELTPLQSIVDALPAQARVVGSAVLVAAALAAGYLLGFKFGKSKNAGLAIAAAMGTVAGASVYAMRSCVPEVAAVSLHNLAAGYDDPMDLTKEDIEKLVQKYGVSKQDDAFIQELCNLYSRYISSVLPSLGENLEGDEVEKIIQFKKRMGIDDPEAASVHMEVGRRIFRERLETGDRESDMVQRRAFHQLVYVSSLVFGEAAKFLLPWKRLFKVTDSEVEIAIRDNAQRLYASKLSLFEMDFDENQLISLREAQLRYKLSDEIAANMFRERERELVEKKISIAAEMVKFRVKTSKKTTMFVEELEKVLAFNDKLTLASKHLDAERFAVGLGPVSLLGGEYDIGRKSDDLKLLYKAYASECFPNGRLDKNKVRMQAFIGGHMVMLWSWLHDCLNQPRRLPENMIFCKYNP